MVLDWILDAIPLWVWIALGVALVIGVFAALRILGLSPKQVWALTAAAGAAVCAFLLHQKGRQSGYRAAQERQRRADEKARRKAEEIDRRVNARPASENRERLKRWDD